jgi:hypothetical protein
MAELESETFTIWREIGHHGENPVLEAAPSVEPGARITIWPGNPPGLPAGVHPLLAMPIGQGSLNGTDVWLEDRPGGVLLSDLDAPLSREDSALLVAQVADALGALHARGHAHGQVKTNRVVITLDGTPVLIGAGAVEGSIADDLKAIVSLLGALTQDTDDISASSAAAIAASLRERADSRESSSLDLRELIECAMLPPPAHPKTVRIALIPRGSLDEVQPDLGPDERVRGLLDRWSNTGSNDEHTEDRTETISASELAAQGRRVMLERLAELYQRPALQGRFESHEGTPCEPLKALIADEPLDALPVPDGVLRRSAAIPDPEPTVEVTQEAPLPGLPHIEDGPTEASGWTGGETTTPRIEGISTLTIALIAALVALTVLVILAAYLTYGVP